MPRRLRIGCEGSHKRAEEEEEVDEIVYLLKRCNFITNKEIKKLIRGCDDLISGIESDLASAKSGLKGSKRKKRSKHKEIKQLIRDCDDLIDGLESDLALARCGLKGSKRYKGSKNEIRQPVKGSKRKKISKYNKEIKKLIRECDDLINGIELDLSLVNKCKCECAYVC